MRLLSYYVSVMVACVLIVTLVTRGYAQHSRYIDNSDIHG